MPVRIYTRRTPVLLSILGSIMANNEAINRIFWPPFASNRLGRKTCYNLDPFSAGLSALGYNVIFGFSIGMKQGEPVRARKRPVRHQIK
jgi:hypothetical protein